jgi:hypothetical protein
MPSTKTVTNAITRAQNEYKGIVLGNTDALDFANEVYQILGMATFWDWLSTTGTTFGTVANQQDYATVPADFRRLKAAWVNDDSSAFTPMIPLSIRESLAKTNTRGLPRAISVENQNFRLFPMPITTRTVSGQWAIYFEYWKASKRLTALGDTFEFPDQYFEVFTTGFNARIGQFMNRDDAGQWMGRNPAGQFVASGMWGKFAGLLNNIVREEELASGPVIWAPEVDFMRY